MIRMDKQGLAKKLTESGQISTAGKAAVIHAITIVPGTDASSLEITNASGGTSLWKVTDVGRTAVGDFCLHATFEEGLICSTDAYGVVAGTGAYAYILYDEQA